MTLARIPQTSCTRALHAFCGRNNRGNYAFMVCIYEPDGAFLSFHIDFTTRRFWAWRESDGAE